MLRTILSIAGKPGLFRLVSQGRNMLIVESLANGKRMPVYSRDKVMSLGDIAIYTMEDDVPLSDVLELVKEKTEGQPVNLNELEEKGKMRDFFGEVLVNFDRERVHDSDIRKLFQWYNILLGAGITQFKEEEKQETEEKASKEEKSEEKE